MLKKNLQRCAIMLALTGCAQQGSVYWNEKDGAVTVHHVTGKTDQVERLVKKAAGDGYQVVTASEPIIPKTDNKLETKVEKLTAKVASLEERLGHKQKSEPKSEAKADPPKVPIDIRNAMASDRPDPRPEPTSEEDTPRMSQ